MTGEKIRCKFVFPRSPKSTRAETLAANLLTEKIGALPIPWNRLVQLLCILTSNEAEKSSPTSTSRDMHHQKYCVTTILLVTRWGLQARDLMKSSSRLRGEMQETSEWILNLSTLSQRGDTLPTAIIQSTPANPVPSAYHMNNRRHFETLIPPWTAKTPLSPR